MLLKATYTSVTDATKSGAQAHNDATNSVKGGGATDAIVSGRRMSFFGNA